MTLSKALIIPVVDALRQDDDATFCNLTYHYGNLELIIPTSNYSKNRTTLDNNPYLVDVAAYYGAEKCLKYLFSLMNSIKHLDKESFTIAHYAIFSGNINICQILLEFGFRFDIQSKDGTTPIHIASKLGFTDICQWIWTNHLSNDLQVLLNSYDLAGMTPIHYAAKNHHFDTVDFFIKAGVDPNTPNSIGRTILHNAIIENDQILSEYCFNRKFPDIHDLKGFYSIHFAAYYRRIDVLRRLISVVETKSDLSIQLNDALRHSQSTDFGYFDDFGTIKNSQNLFNNLQIEDNNGHNALHVAASKGFYEGCLLLIEAGIDVDSQDSKGRTPIHLAARNGFFQICDLLIDYGADFCLYDDQGYTPMNWAFLRNRQNCVNLFAELGETNENIDVENPSIEHHVRNPKWGNRLKIPISMDDY